MSLKHDQSGFGIVEIILVIVVVGLLGAVGWLVYDRQSDKKSEAINTSEVSESQNTPTATSYLEIKEWGVKIPLTDEYANASYSIEVGPGIATSGAAEISVDGDMAGYFTRYKMGETVYSPAGDDMGKFDQGYIDQGTDFYTKVGDYYYTFIGSQGGGSEKQDAFEAYLAIVRKDLEAV